MVASIEHKSLGIRRPGVAAAVRLLPAAGVIAVSVLFGGAALAADCGNAKERASFNVRVLQSKLMVAAFLCDARSEYNAFVTRYQPALRRHGKAITGYFERNFAADGQRRLDRFVTAVANEASSESNADLRRFCADARSVMRQLDRQRSARLDPEIVAGFVSGSPSKAEVCRLAAR